MYKEILKYIYFTGLLISQSAFAAPVLFEDFSGPINLQKFTDVENSRKLDTTNKNLILSSKGSSYLRNYRSNNLGLLNHEY